MKVSLKLILGLSSISTIACAPKVTSAPPTVTVDESRSFDRHLTARMREAFAEQDVPDSLAKSSKDVAFLTRGGPPGAVTLEGGLVKSPTTPSEQVSVQMGYGIGRNGSLPKVRTPAPNLFLRQSDASRELLDDVAGRKDYVKIGCGFTDLEPVDGLTRVDVKESSVLRIKAKVVQICAKSTSNFYSLHVVADRIVISTMDLGLEGLATRQLSLIAKDLVLLGKVSVRTKAPDDELTYAPGPSVFVSAERVSGAGQLSVQASGANFIPKR